MPLLNKKVFHKASPPENLKDDDEVFYCEATDELFLNYDDFSERMFLCTSMVWTCSLTGKANLTYAEAVESEENAKESIKDFSKNLKVPLLYIATRTKRTAFGEMSEDVFNYIKDRFFVGEHVETSCTGTKWKESHIVNVLPPSNDNLNKTANNGKLSTPSLSKYKYEVEHLDTYDADISEIMVADFNQIRRKKIHFSREKCKVFLKQYVEQDDFGIFVIKPAAIEEYGLNNVNFQNIFVGQPPEFEHSKKIFNGKKVRQESLDKFLTKSNGTNNDLLEKMKKREEELRLKKQHKKEEEVALKQKKKEENMAFAAYLRAWKKPIEDLELDDQKRMPPPTPVKSKVPDEYFGDMLMVLEFVHSFSKLLSTKDFFPEGLTIEIMERALIEKEVAGPLIDLIQMFLSALFNVQDEEASQYRTEIEKPSSIKQEETSNDMDFREATRLATVASTWSKKYQGLPLGRLPLYSLTTSEIVRLHLLGSGAIIKFTGARWRYQQRGGYTSEDDPGLYLRLHSPHILKALRVCNIVELPICDKLEILSCLMNQLLTYADVRDIVEERIETIKQAKLDYKLLVTTERKRESEFLTARVKLKKELKGKPELLAELQKLELQAERKKAENEEKLERFRKIMHETEPVLGHDRAFRQYMKLNSVPGFFVTSDDQNPGVCLTQPVKPNPDLVHASRDQVMVYLKKKLQEENLKDKEIKSNGEQHLPNDLPNGIQEDVSFNDLMVCSSDSTSCVVHNPNISENKWGFHHEINKVNELIDCLNQRGLRESQLHEALKTCKDSIESLVVETPVSVLNSDIKVNEQEEPKRSTKSKAKYENANLGYSQDMSPEDILHNALVENVLELEEKISAGNLGYLFIKDREKWRNCLQNKMYNELDKTLTPEEDKRENREKSVDSVNSDYLDPGQCLDLVQSDTFIQKAETKEAIQSLAIALVQIARSVEPKYLKKPLGKVNYTKNDKSQPMMLGQWEQSLLASTSFSQVFLHYSTLDLCVMWGKSVLLARCRICRRQTDSENMLLCDGCNCGHHLYCLKPKLKTVPPGDWFCNKCQKDIKIASPVPEEPAPKKRRIFRDDEGEDDDSNENTNDEASSSDEDNDDEKDDIENGEENEECDNQINGIKIDVCKECQSGGEVVSCEKCSSSYHIECLQPPLRRIPRGAWLCDTCKDKSRKRNDSSDEEVINKRGSRRDEVRDDLPLHNAALQDVLSEIMKDYNAWPFLRPVHKIEVPDYYDVITKPMDFGTIKYKLNMGEYREDAQFMSDALLVFQNCNTYNHTEDDVFKCGVELLKHFQKKCREVGLKLPEELDYDDTSVRPKKKIRTK